MDPSYYQPPYHYSQPDTQTQYPMYYPTHYSQQQDHLHPPGVNPDPNPTGSNYTYTTQYQPPTTGYYDQQQLVYSDPGTGQVQQFQGNGIGPAGGNDVGLISAYPAAATAQTQNSVAGRGGGRPFRGGGSSFRGRGRGRGRGGSTTSGQAKVKPPPQMAWCELCRVDCNTLEILETHKNGKKHKKNLKMQEELQLLAQKNQEAQMAAAEVAVSNEMQPPAEALSSDAVAEESGQPGQARGSKRKARGGRGGKWLRTNDGSRKSAEPAKPKEVVPFVCELCNVKCESTQTFDSHLKGKKHLMNVRHFQEQQAAIGQVFYPVLQALYPALLEVLSQQHPADASTSGIDPEQRQQLLQCLQNFAPQAGTSTLPQVTGPESAQLSDVAAQAQSEFQSQTQQNSVIDDSTAAAEAQGAKGPADGVENQVEPEVKTDAGSSATEPTQ